MTQYYIKKKLLIPEIVPNKNKQIKEDEKDTNEKIIFLNENNENNSLINKFNNIESFNLLNCQV